MFTRVVISFLLVAALTSLAGAGVIRDGSLSAYSNGNSIVVRWISEDETGITGFTIERRAGVDGPFIELTSPALSVKGSGSTYEFIDNSAFRVTDNIYQYRVTAVGTNAVYYVSVRHNTSGVRRTWGSIKAMFR